MPLHHTWLIQMVEQFIRVPNMVLTQKSWKTPKGLFSKPLQKSIFTENISDVHVKVGVGAIKSVSKHTDGRIQETEWTYSPCGNKVDFVAKDLKSGKCCKMSFEKFCDFSGSYKIISRSGLEEFCKVTGEEIEPDLRLFWQRTDVSKTWLPMVQKVPSNLVCWKHTTSVTF